MTHLTSMPDSAGDFSDYKEAVGYGDHTCGSADVRYRIWESHCGGYEDYHYRCFGCGKTWWVEGPDA